MDSSRFEAGLGRQVAQDQEGAGAREPAAFRVEEELGSVPCVQERASPSQVTPQCLCGLPADRDDPFLVALNFHGDFAILAGAFNSLNNREIATRGDKQAKGNYRKKSGKVSHASS